jgi:hypothetical protein
LQTGFNQPAGVGPGATIYLRGGTYRGKFISNLTGSSSSPITVRSYPGEWAKVDGYLTTTLTQAISSSATTITLADGSRFPANTMVDIDTADGIREDVMLNSKNGNTYSVTRAARAPAQASHSAGAIVIFGYTISGPGIGVITINGSDTVYRDFEVMSSNPVRATTIYVDASEAPTFRGAGFTVFGPRTKFFNLVIHDTQEGFGAWLAATDNEFYGNIIYNGGWVDPNRGNGHGFYLQNQGPGWKRIYDTISFNNFATGMKAFGVNAIANNIEYNGVISFGNGTPALYSGSPALGPGSLGNLVSINHVQDNLFAGTGSNPLQNVIATNNFAYHKAGKLTGLGNLGMGWAQGSASTNLTVTNNYIVGGNIPYRMLGWSNATVTGNTFYGTLSTETSDNGAVDLTTAPAGSRSYTWNNNTYYYTGTAAPFRTDGSSNDFAGWKSRTGYDSNSTFAASRPTGIKVSLRPNRYEAGRANIVIYNWDLANNVTVDLSLAGLANGQVYEIRNVQNYFGAPVLTGTYNSAAPAVSIPMTSAAATAVVSPIGHVFTPPTTLPEFGVFVVVPR